MWGKVILLWERGCLGVVLGALPHFMGIVAGLEQGPV